VKFCEQIPFPLRCVSSLIRGSAGYSKLLDYLLQLAQFSVALLAAPHLTTHAEAPAAPLVHAYICNAC